MDTKKLEPVFRSLLDMIDPDPDREGIKETPKRMAKAWGEWTSGYHIDPASVFKTFEDGAENYLDEMVVVRNIRFYSVCEHHLAPFFGEVSIAYIPDKKIVGLSKFARLVNVFAKRLQVQERLTTQLADTIEEILGAKGVGVRVVARHLCMESRGVEKHGSETITTAIRGVMREASARAEFLRNV